MASKKELEKAISDLQGKVKELNGIIDEQSQDWVTPYQYAQEMKVKADQTVALYGANKKDVVGANGELVPKIKRLWQFSLPFETGFAQTYWFEANRFADWWCAYLSIDCLDIRFYEQFELFKRYFFLWGEACMCKKDDMWFCGRVVEKLGNNKVKVCFDEINFRSWDYVSGAEIKWKEGNDIGEFEIGVDCVYARCFWDAIGFYVKAIPYLGSYIYFLRQLEKNMSWANIVPICSIMNPLQKGQLMSFLSDCDTFEVDIARLSAAERTTQQEVLFDRIKWLIPEGIKEHLDSQILNLEKHFEILCNNFGRPITNASGEQRLSADSNTFASNSEYIAENILNRFKIACEELISIGMPLMIEESPLEKEEEIDGLENENAKKEEDQKTGEFNEHKGGGK